MEDSIMPYIKPERREDIHVNKGKIFEIIRMSSIQSAGELNFAITVLCGDYLDLKGLSYQHINEVIGVLECAKQEFYRRVAVPYEDEKCMENGDVYPWAEKSLDNMKK